MKNKSGKPGDPVPHDFHKSGNAMDPFKIQNPVPGVDIPGFGKHYSCLSLKGPMAKKKGVLAAEHGSLHDPCFWNRGGGRWFHTKRRGGQVGRQRDRSLPGAHFKE